jgi:hypothetical protein
MARTLLVFDRIGFNPGAFPNAPKPDIRGAALAVVLRPKIFTSQRKVNRAGSVKGLVGQVNMISQGDCRTGKLAGDWFICRAKTVRIACKIEFARSFREFNRNSIPAFHPRSHPSASRRIRSYLDRINVS